jgi:DNA-damage-inducible protein D
MVPMKKAMIEALFQQFEQACYDYNGVECWSARELQPILGYLRWENFNKVIERAKIACENAEGRVTDHFVAQNGDASKQAIAFAQTYFAVQTRKQEIIEKRLLDIERVTAREKLSKSEKKLSGIIYERGIDEKGFAFIRSKGDEALFGGFSTQHMKQKMNVPAHRPLADFLPVLTIKAKDFATELTSHNVVEKDLKGEDTIGKEHIDNNLAVRKMLKERGVKPEQLPPDEDIKKVQRQLQRETKQTAQRILKGK